MKTVALLLSLGIALCAEPPVRLAYSCPAEDIESFGLGCSADEPCAVFLEIAAVESSGTRLFVTGNLHTETTTLYGILLSSDDNGSNWTEPFKRVRSAALDQIQFLDAARGWISGQIIEPLPRDPFLLATTDGGDTWVERPLFDEQHFGSIAQFWFDSENHGELVLDSDGDKPGQERYESSTGGEKWENKPSAGEPLHLKPARAAAWRVRADASTKTYRIEKRAGSTWESVASFLIHVADCN